MKEKTALITGCSGFLGSNLIAFLQREGWQVAGIDLRPAIFVQPDIFYSGDIRDCEIVERILNRRKYSVVFHLAAVSTIQGGFQNPQLSWSVNYFATKKLINTLCEVSPDTAFLYASTDKVYGSLNGKEAYTEDLPLCPIPDSPYDCSKAAADALVQASNLPALVFRFCNLYGLYDTSDSRVVPANIRAMLQGFPGIINQFRDKKGNPVNFYRDMLFVEDLCETLVALANRLLTDRLILKEKVFNIGFSQPISIPEIIHEIILATGSALQPLVRDVAVDRELKRQCVDSSKARTLLGFAPHTSLREGIGKTTEWWKASMIPCR